MEFIVSKAMNENYANGSSIDRSDLPLSVLIEGFQNDSGQNGKSHSRFDDAIAKEEPDFIPLSKLSSKLRYQLFKDPEKYKLKRVGRRWLASKAETSDLLPTNRPRISPVSEKKEFVPKAITEKLKHPCRAGKEAL